MPSLCTVSRRARGAGDACGTRTYIPSRRAEERAQVDILGGFGQQWNEAAARFVVQVCILNPLPRLRIAHPASHVLIRSKDSMLECGLATRGGCECLAVGNRQIINRRPCGHAARRKSWRDAREI